MATKIKGFNEKEQKLFNKLSDGNPHNIAELKKIFWETAKKKCDEKYEKGWGDYETDIQAQSYVRNSIRRLVRDGWVSQTGRGTYTLTKDAKKWLAEGKTITDSATDDKRKRKRHINVDSIIKRRFRPSKKKTAKPKKKPIEKKAKASKNNKESESKTKETPKIAKSKTSKRKKTEKVKASKSKGSNGVGIKESAQLKKLRLLRAKLEDQIAKEEKQNRAQKAIKRMEEEENV
jgi:hypothetical protein